MPRSSDPLLQRLHTLRVERDDWARIARQRADEIARLRQRVLELEAAQPTGTQGRGPGR